MVTVAGFAVPGEVARPARYQQGRNMRPKVDDSLMSGVVSSCLAMPQTSPSPAGRPLPERNFAGGNG